jgi:predicted membrane-bound spermidine synthase
MEVPLWKRWLSYLTPLTLEVTSSPLNPELTVLVDRGRLQLLSGDAIYSWDDLYLNFAKAFEVLEPAGRGYQEVLVLGLGLGSVPYLLEKKHQVTYYYTAVEWDEVVADLADRYTFSRLKSPVEMVVADASVFVEVCTERYDMVVVDLFQDSQTPEEFETTEFLEACVGLLRPGGLLLLNRLSKTNKDQVLAERYLEGTFKKVLPEGQMIDTDGNWILYWERPH